MAIGQSLPRRVTYAVVSGREDYVADFAVDQPLWARIVRSYEPHGAITGIDVDAAGAVPGVVEVITAESLGQVPDIPMRVYRTEIAERALQPVLATDRVRYVGEPYAVVLASDPFACEDAAETIAAFVDPLPVSVDPHVTPSDPLHAGLPDNVADHVVARGGDDVDEVFARAAVTVRRTLHFGRQTACPMECRGLLAIPGERPRLTLVGPTKVKQFNREVLAGLLGLQLEDVHFVESAVGGSFGARGEFYPEDFLVPWLALRHGRPVKWLEDRAEHFTAMNHAREAWAEVDVGLSADGDPLAIRARVHCDLGAYVRTNGLSAARAIALHVPGPYRWQAWQVDVAGVLTNKTPAATYRAPGAVEATYFREVVVDEAIRELGRDPLQLKRSWLPGESEMPHVVEGGHDHIVVETGDWRAMWDAVEPARSTGDSAQRGIGSAPFFVEEGFGPADEARVRSGGEGRVVVEVGAGAAGQGMETSLAQIAAEAIGVPAQLVRVEHRELENPPDNGGTFASRVTVFTGSAVHHAALDFVARAREEAAERLERPVDEMPAEEILRLPALEAVGEGSFDRTEQTATSGVVFATVEVDPQLLQVRLTHLALAVDAGRTINPLLADQQIIGGAMQGIGGALLEEIRYDEYAQPTQATFMDYHVPLAAHLPELDIRRFEFAAKSNPLGAKGVGELGIVAVAAAVSNAVADAVGRCPDAVPCTPAVLARLLLTGEQRSRYPD